MANKATGQEPPKQKLKLYTNPTRMTPDWTLIQLTIFLAGSLLFLAGTIIGIIHHLNK